ncbi:hypothetical protein CCR75_002169 [Bremia lactucae]|uniref:Uncharacterized protein n=1 Tax=Bremia lactucae TaxID=4779 RepID=A0A976FH68_BRELC|nr:hypothetical protein CCR75_002169 [Bremia lactucae]
MKVWCGTSLRWRQAACLVLTTGGAVTFAKMAPSLYDYKYDGSTTYCYWMDQGMQVSNLDFAYVLEQGVGIECPLTISLQQATTGAVYTDNEIEYAFTATLNLNDNALKLTELQTAVPDPATGLPMEIGHANIHSCTRATVCDIFRTGANRKIVDQETSNFTSSGTASFRQKIVYHSAGERNIFAHIILPAKNFTKESYHFVTFITTNVLANASTEDKKASSGLSIGVTVGLVIGAVVFVTLVILAVVFWRRKRRPGQDMDHSNNSGFGLPASYVANKSKSHLNWNAEPETRLTSHDSGFKDNYGGRSRGPGLNASALMFNERLSRQNKTVSSSGSLHSSRGQNENYSGYDTPMQRSANKMGDSTCSGKDQFNQSQLMYPDDSMFGNEESSIAEEDPSLEYGRTPDLETFGIGSGSQGPSYESETSIGTSYGYNGDGGAYYAQPPFNPLLSGYGRESDASSIGAPDSYNMYDEPPSRIRGDTLEAMLTSAPGDQGNDNGNFRTSSVSSIGTVDFTQDEPSVRSQKPITFEALDETLTMSAIAKAKTENTSPSTKFDKSTLSGKSEFALHDSSVTLSASSTSSDYASTMSSIDIDAKMNSIGETVSNSNNPVDIAASGLEASIVGQLASHPRASASDDLHHDYDEGSSFDSGLEDLSYGSGSESSSCGTNVTSTSYGAGLTSSSYGTELTTSTFNAHVADSKQDAIETESDFSNTQSTFEFDDKSFRGSNSFAVDDDPMTDDSLRPRSVSSADGESYEF